METATVR